MSERQRVVRADITWREDCGGKMDYDGGLVGVSSRAYPEGLAFSTIRVGEKEFLRKEFEGSSLADVQKQVEEWVDLQVTKIFKILQQGLIQGGE